MKWNWGTGIATVMGIFMIGILSAVVVAFRSSVDLVSADYYAEEIAYQDRIDAIERSKSKPIKIALSKTDGQIQFKFPDVAGRPIGNILFFKPDNAKMDWKVKVNPDEGKQQNIAVTDFSSGLWRIKVDWKANGLSYYDEQTLVLP